MSEETCLFERVSKLEAPIKLMEEIIVKCDKEIKMWRQLYIESLCLPEDEKMIFTAYLMATPAGIEDMDDWNKQLKCYRET